MVGVNLARESIRALFIALIVLSSVVLPACVSTEELYAEYDALHCDFVIKSEKEGVAQLHERNTSTDYLWMQAVYFEFDVSELDDTQAKQLSKALFVLKQFPQLHLSLQGFTDYKGGSEYNLALAERRTATISKLVQEQGIDRSRILLLPIGEVKAVDTLDSDDPAAIVSVAGDAAAAPNTASTDDTEAINRRVELMLLDADKKPIDLKLVMDQ